MDAKKRKAYIQRKLAPKKYATGQLVSSAASGAAAGSVIPGIGTVVGAIGGFIAGLFGGGPQMPNITDPVTGQQITDASGRVVASQQQLQQYANTLQGGAGPQAQNSAIQLLSQIETGGGPNPAAAMLQQATAQNASNQAALQAGQRGAASNVGLIAREAAQTGAGLQQTAVGQAATTESQQQIGAAEAAGNIAAQQENAAIGAGSAAGNIALGNQGQVLQAQTGFNQQIAGGQANVNTTNASTTNTALAPSGIVSQGLGGASNTATANGISAPTPQQVASVNTNPAPEYTNGPSLFQYKGGKIAGGPHKSHAMNWLMAGGGNVKKKVDAFVSPGEIYLSPEDVKKVQYGHNPLKLGKKVPGKPKVKGDSIKNDNVSARLEEGGVVLPRHIATKKDKDKATLFVLKSIAKGSKHAR